MKLSIITINYNNKDGLQKTIDSVIGQTWQDYEWIIIDGGSTDGSKELIEKYQKHFAYWCSEPDKGIYNAMNKGIAKAKGKYVSCMNSGDAFCESNTLRNVFSTDRSADILFGDSVEIYSDHTNTNYYPSPTPIEFHNLYRWCFCHQAMFVKTKMLQEKGFDETYQLYADRCRWTQAALDGNSFEYLNMPICNYDMSGLSQTIDKAVYKTELERIRKEVIPLSILLSTQKLVEYEENETIQKIRWLLMRGKLTVNLTKAVIRLLDSIIRVSSALLHNSIH